MSDHDTLSRLGSAVRRGTRRTINFVLISIAIVLCVVLALGAALYGFNWFTHGRHAEQVEVFVYSDAELCKDPQFPLTIIIGNKSPKRIEHTHVELSAKRKGRSSNVAQYHTYSDDQIIDPNEVNAACWAALLQSDVRESPRELEWSVKSKRVTFAK